jgi:hypothetical protein
VDFAATVLSLAEVKLPPHLQGTAFLGAQAGPPRKYVHAIRDRMAERFDTVRVVRDHRFQYHRNFLPHLSWSQFSSYTEEMPTMKAWRQLANEGRLAGPAARYFSPTKPLEELYDNAADPDHVKNLAADPRHRDTLERLRAECARWMKATGDLGLLPEPEMLVRARGVTPWEIATDPRQNPLDDLLRAAALANEMKPANAARLGVLLGHADAALRWWGAVGLVALGRDARPAESALRQAMRDDSVSVSIAAAEALGNLGDHAAALPVLTKALEHEAPLVRLEALNVLDRFGARAKPALAAIRAAKVKLDEQTTEFINGVARTGGGVQPALQAQAYVAEYVNRMVEYVPARIEQAK